MDAPNPLMPAGYDIAWSIMLALHLVIFLVALISILASKRYTGGGKLLWILVVLAYPVLGALGWLILGRRATIIRA